MQVVPAKQFKRGPEIYSMTRNPRGSCIILNNTDFEECLGRREESELDVHRMEALFHQLHFKVTVASNLSAIRMKEVLSDAAKVECQQDADCLVVILMSHGSKGVIYGTDGEKLHLDRQVYPLFDNHNCPALRGKPKLFFVQASRGDMWDDGIRDELETLDAPKASSENSAATSWHPPLLDSNTGDVLQTADTTQAAGQHHAAFSRRSHKPTTSCSDMYIAYATRPGYVALTNKQTGSWFLSAVYEVFSQHACTRSLDGLMRLVCERVMDRCAHDGGKQTPSINTIGWRKELYFNPGLYI